MDIELGIVACIFLAVWWGLSSIVAWLTRSW
jgi:hypothetical protein